MSKRAVDEPKIAEPLVDRARRELEERFITLQLAPGSVWSEVSLSELLGIGRTPVREATARMAMDGLLVVMPRAGILVSSISIEEQMAVLETRRVLEKLVSMRAARRASDAERVELAAMADSIERSGRERDVRGYLHSHFVIKRFVARCARNVFSERALRPLHTLSQRFYFAFHREFDNLEEVGGAHARLTRAISMGDEDGAGVLCDAVSDIADQFTRELFMGKSGSSHSSGIHGKG